MDKAMNITMDSHALKSFLTNLEMKQIPFATAVALTRTAQEAQSAIKTGLSSKFIQRNKWTAGGIIFQRAEKKDWPNTQSIVGSRDEYMIKQEEGGNVAPKNKRHAIPNEARPSPTRLIPRKSRIENLNISFNLPQGGRPSGAMNGTRKTPQPFIAIPKSKKMGVYIRTGEYYKHNGKSIEKFKLLYRLQDKPTKYSKKEWLEKIVTDIASKNLQDNFERAMAEALTNAK